MKLWSGCFDGDISAETLAYTHTVDIDERMIVSDLWGSLAHVLMLSHQAIIPKSDGRAISRCLLMMLNDAVAGKFELDKQLEDVHLNVESAIIKQIGIETGGKIHTARSRNDQVTTDLRLYVRNEIIWLGEELLSLASEFLNKARDHRTTLMLGHTHSQPAQPISYAFWLSCYSSIFIRDAERLLNTYSMVNKNPLGACALAGTSFPIDRSITTKLMGFDGLALHSLDATSSRDFVVEIAANLAITMSNISRFCEEVVYWNGFEYGLFNVGDAFATGSSIMPQKKNPVVAELARARCGVAFGSLFELLAVVKSVSLGYSCDLQQDKPPLWRSIDNAKATLSILRSQVATIKYNEERARLDCWNSFSTATELANYLVSQKEKPFRVAHEIVGNLVKQLASESKTLADTNRACQLLSDSRVELTPSELEFIVDPNQTLNRQRSSGSTGPDSVLEMIEQFTSEIERLGTTYDEKQRAHEYSLQQTQHIATAFVSGQEITNLLPN